MTTITYSKFKNGFRIKAEGHSGYANAGSDIVCASISTAIEMAYGVAVYLLDGVILYSDEKKPSMTLHINHHNIIAKAIAQNLMFLLLDLQEQYSKYIKIEGLK